MISNWKGKYFDLERDRTKGSREKNPPDKNELTNGIFWRGLLTIPINMRRLNSSFTPYDVIQLLILC